MIAALTQTPNSESGLSLTEGESWASQRRETLRDLDAGELKSFISVKEFDIETDYKPGRIPMEGSLYLQVNDHGKDPLRLGFDYDNATVSVKGWGLTVPSAERHNLPEAIGRRFFELYSHSINGKLSEQDEACLDCASRQVDYRSYLAARVLPRYREATLMRHEPVLLLQFLDTINVKLDKSLGSVLRHVRLGERFGAWFTTTPEGAIVGIQNPMILPNVGTDDAKLSLPIKPVEFPDSLKSLLPKPAAELE